MATAFWVVVVLAAGGLVLAYRMNWLGLFLSEERMGADRQEAKERMRVFGSPIVPRPLEGKSDEVGPGRAGEDRLACAPDAWRDVGGEA